MDIKVLKGLQAQHSILIGNTGQGKSWILNQLLLLTAGDSEYGTSAWQLLRDELKGGLEAVNDSQASEFMAVLKSYSTLHWPYMVWLCRWYVFASSNGCPMRYCLSCSGKGALSEASG